ncbi:MAG: lipoprotein-releasing ABC transporter permease subunit [Desulfatibacillaceae bacterium]
MSYEWFMGRRYLRSKGREAFVSLITWLSMGGVAVGAMALIVVISVMAGFEADLKQSILGITSHIRVFKPADEFSEYAGVTERLAAMDGVSAAAPFAKGQVMIRSDRQTMGVVLMGIQPERMERGFSLGEYASPGALAALVPENRPETAFPGVVLGSELALHLGVGVGDSVYAVSPEGTLTPVGMMPTMRRLEVTGTVTSGMYEYDTTMAWVDLSTARRVLRLGRGATGVELRLGDLYTAPKMAARISENLGEAYEVRDWAEMNSNLFAALKLEKVAMFVVLCLIVTVAAFNIASTLIMTVMEKRKDIAILKTMGATGPGVRKIFMYNGMIIGAVGTLVGVGLGVAACVLLDRYQFIQLDTDVFYIPTLPVRMRLFDVLAVSCAALAISLAATIYPAWRAARTDPVEIIRYG